MSRSPSARTFSFSGTAAPDRVGRLLQAAVRGTRGGAALSVALHPSHCHLQPSADRCDGAGVAFHCKDYRIEGRAAENHDARTTEFIRRFLIHVLPKGFHRIRHYGLFANGNRAENIAKARDLLAAPRPRQSQMMQPLPQPPSRACCHAPCPCCGGRMIVIEIFARGGTPDIGDSPNRHDHIDTS